MQERQTSGFYNSKSFSSAALGSGRRAQGSRPPAILASSPPRRSSLVRLRTSGEEDSLPSLEEGRRYLFFWALLGVLFATILATGVGFLIHAKGSFFQTYPWSLWAAGFFSFVGYALWNLWYIRQSVMFQHKKQQMIWQEKNAQNTPKERMFEQLIASAGNAEPAYQAARMNAILRIPDFILSRGQEGSYFRTVGCGLLGAILMEINSMERAGQLDRNQEMIKRVTFKALMSVKEHLNGISLQSVNLSGLQLSFANLSRADLSASHLTEADLQEANLQSVNLEFSDLQYANLQSADMQGANLLEATLVGSNLSSARLRGMQAKQANFQSAHLNNAELTEANLSGANLQMASLEGAVLRFADLRGASLAGANLEGADLEGADLEGADLNGANLNGARTQGANMPRH